MELRKKYLWLILLAALLIVYGQSLMLSGFLLALREGIEAALVISIALSVLKKMGRMDQAKRVWLGAGSAGLVALAVAVLLNLIGAEFEGAGEQIFEGVTMVAAAGALTWMIFWMKKHGRHMQVGMEANLKDALSNGQGWALFSLAFFAVLREGVELALFLTAIDFSAAPDGGGTTTLGWVGGLLGLLAAAVIGEMIFDAAARTDLRHFFRYTTLLLIVFAAGLVGHAIHEFNELGWVPNVIERLYDLTAVLPESSAAGQFLKSMFGYNADPSLTEAAGYVAYMTAAFYFLTHRQATDAKRP
mgnify:CR=1 FL=1